MANMRDPEKRMIAFWLLPKEIKLLDRLTAEAGLADRHQWLRRQMQRTPAPVDQKPGQGRLYNPRLRVSGGRAPRP